MKILANGMVLNVSIRLFALLLRLLLSLSVARVLSDDNLASFYLITALIGFSVIPLGFDFYIYSTREYARGYQFLSIIKSSLKFYSFTYSVFIPLIFFFSAWYFSISIAVLVILILIFEHLGQEMYRIYIISGRPLLSSSLMFLRGAVWVIPLLIFDIVDSYSLETVLYLWVSFAFLSLIIGGFFLNINFKSLFNVKVDLDWFRSGVSVCCKLIIGTVALKVIFFLDRYFIESINGGLYMSAYSFFFGLFLTSIAIYDSSVNAYKMKFLLAYKPFSNDYWKVAFIMVSSVFLISTPFLVLALNVDLFLSLVDIERFEGLEYLSFYCFFSVFFLLFSSVIGGFITSTKKDFGNYVGNIFPFVAFLMMIYVFWGEDDFVPLAVLLSLLSMFIFKLVYFMKCYVFNYGEILSVYR